MPESTGIVDKNRMNKTEGKHIHNYSTFNKSLSYRLYNTHRFGDYTPTFVMEGVPKDEINLNSLDRIDSLSLKAPFKGSIRKIKETFMVPNMAILPLQWDRIYAQNSNGDDVPQDANCILLNFPTNFKNLWLACITAIYSAPQTTWAEVYSFLTGLLRTMVLGEFVYSNGSLLNVLGYKSSTQFQWSHSVNGFLSVKNYDDWFDDCASRILTGAVAFEVTEPVGGSTVVHHFSTVIDVAGYEPIRAMFELFRENPLCYITNVTLDYTYDFSSYVSDLSQLFISTFDFRFSLPSSSYTGDPADITSLNPNVLNLSRLLAYQLITAHFYSNSSIDFIYSAELYRQYVYHLSRSVLSLGSGVYNFSWNGMSMVYDYLSGHVLNIVLALTNVASVQTNFINNLLVNSSTSLTCLAIWSAVFGFRKSLRYGDYFTASRPRPLAPINTDVSVNSNLVSVIDITRNIQAQRFANAVMRSRSKIEEYVKSLFGNAPAPDFHNPFFLTRSEEIIFGDYVQNTAGAQTTDANSRTANFAANLDRHTFTFHNDDMHPCIYMQIVSYDTPRAYTRSVNRQFLHVDRFDMFNPDFQYIGDQPVYGIELGYFDGSNNIPNIFSYQSRDMEYKQRYDESSSGFASGKLPGWCFDDSRLNWVGFPNINPDFIRSRNVDIDYLYLALTGYSLGNYFHFTCVTDNNVNAKRAMAVDPQILQ